MYWLTSGSILTCRDVSYVASSLSLALSFHEEFSSDISGWKFILLSLHICQQRRINLLYDNDVFKEGEEDKYNADAHPNVQG